MKEKRITIRDIARKAGVAHSTVSRVINNTNVSQGTKTKVLKIIRQQNYHPNLIARGLSKRKTQALALIVPELKAYYILRIIEGIEQTCKSLNYALMLFSTHPWQDESLSYTEVIKNWLVDGVLILNILYREDLSDKIKKLRSDGIPFVFINKYLGREDINAVGIDNRDGVFKAVEHLVNLSYKRIGIINGGLMSVDGLERFQAYKDALKKFDLKYDDKIVGYGDFMEKDGYAEMKSMLFSPSIPEAVFCANDLMAIGAIRAVKEKGLKVPDDVAIIGFDDIETASLVEPPLTTIRAPLEDIGAKAIRLMLDIAKNPHKPAEEIVLKTRLIVRESCGEKKK